jgi:hypothetical protein
MRNQIVLASAVALFICNLSSAVAEENGVWTAGTGIHYSSGGYGTSATTTILAIPFSARYERGPWTLRASVPYLEISGPSAVIPGVGAVGNSNPRRRGRGATAASEGTASGLGDVVASATYAAYTDRGSQLGVELTGKLKIATADADQGLGTGEHDFAALADLYKVVGKTTLFAGAGYHVLGSSPYIPLDNVWSASVGGSYRIDERDSAGVTYDARQRVSPSASPQRELTAFLARRLDRAWKAQVYALKGFANGSPDWGAGLSLAHSF